MRLTSYIQSKATIGCLLMAFGCGDKDITVPGGTTDSNDVSDFECVMEWSQQNGSWIDPNLCAAWSEKSGPLNWTDAQSYCTSLVEGSIDSWTLPSLADLEDMSFRTPPFEDKEGDLWTTDQDPNSGLYWTVNLSQPGMTILLDGSSEAYARCISR